MLNIVKCVEIQKQDGSILQHGVWDDKFPPRELGLLYMKDGPSWLVICVANYIYDCGNYEFLNMVVKYKDGGENTVLNHLLKAVEFMWKDRGMYGLSLLGDGDCTDPINGPGRKGKGVFGKNLKRIIFDPSFQSVYATAVFENKAGLPQKRKLREY